MKNNLDIEDKNKIKLLLENSGILIFPTDTVWGIGCKYNDKTAVERIYQLKGRDFNNPLQLQFADYKSTLDYINSESKLYKVIAKNFLPGSLSIVTEKSDKVPDYITSGLPTVAIRISNYKPLTELIEYLEFPIASTSCNISGKSTATSYEEANKFEISKNYAILNLDPTTSKQSSTIVDLTNENIKLIREGDIKFTDIQEIINENI